MSSLNIEEGSLNIKGGLTSMSSLNIEDGSLNIKGNSTNMSSLNIEGCSSINMTGGWSIDTVEVGTGTATATAIVFKKDGEVKFTINDGLNIGTSEINTRINGKAANYHVHNIPKHHHGMATGNNNTTNNYMSKPIVWHNQNDY